MKPDSQIGRGVSVCTYRHPILAAINSFLQSLDTLADPVARRWNPKAAAMAAVLMALDAHHPLFMRLASAQWRLRQEASGACGSGQTYNGLIKALVRQAPEVLPVLKADLKRQILSAYHKLPRLGGWLVLAADGSKEELPRTASNESVFGIADNGRCPQALISVVLEVQTGQPWDWRVDVGCGDEKTHLMEMIPELPAASLLVADANYIGYALWAKFQQAHRSFLVRVGGNVQLLSKLFPDAELRRFGRIVYAWPKKQQKSVAPLRLRLIRIDAPGQDVWLLSNVLDPLKLSSKAAGEIYRARWGIETFYRGFKRSMNFAKLRSRSGLRAGVELQWALVACSLVHLMGIQAMQEHKQDPRRLSLAGLLHVVQETLWHHQASGPTARSQRRLKKQLAQCLRDSYRRRSSKRSRYRPRTSNTPKRYRLKPPKIRPATHAQRQLAGYLWPHLVA